MLVRDSRSTRARFSELDILAQLMRGGRHSRHTVAACGVSLPTADRWLSVLWQKVPGVRVVKVGKTTWFEWKPARYMLSADD